MIPAWVLAAGPPQEPWGLPQSVINNVEYWLSVTLYVTLAGAIVAVIIFGAMLALDRDRGEPVSATAPHVRALRIALGVLVMTGAGNLALWFI